MELDSGAPQAEMQEEHLPLRAAPPSRSPLNVQHTVERAKASGKALLWQLIFLYCPEAPRMDGPVATRLALCTEDAIEDLVRAQARVARSIEAARALLAQVKQELTKAVALITSPHPANPSSLELTTRKLLRTSGLLARHLTERLAFEEALPSFSDEIFLPLLRRREENFSGVRLEGKIAVFSSSS